MIEKYRHIIWDWNGTLFNDRELCIEIINGMLAKRNIKALTSSGYRNVFTFPVQEYYRLAGFDFNAVPFEVLGKEWMDEYERRKHECAIFDSAGKVLSRISRMGIEQSVLSAYSHGTLVEIVARCGLDKWLTHLAGLDHIYATSKAAIGMELMAKINLPGREVVLIGDTLHDYEVACGIGAECILIADGHQSREKLLTAGVPVLDSLSEILNI